MRRVPRANVSIKISAMDGHVSPVDAEGSLDRLERAMAPLLQAAGTANVLINFDMEQHSLKELTIRLFKRCCEKYDFPAGIALQAYLKSADADARDLVEWARSRKRLATVRLIKGAYWDYETIHSQMMGWPCPVWGIKRETDACFEPRRRIPHPRNAARGGCRRHHAGAGHAQRAVCCPRDCRVGTHGSAPKPPWNFRPSAAWPTISSSRSPKQAGASANTCPLAK